MNAQAKRRRRQERKDKKQGKVAKAGKGRCQRCGLVVTQREGAVYDGQGAWMCARCYTQRIRKFDRVGDEVNRRVNPEW